MRIADFDYDLPPELIAQRPADRRDASRLLVARATAGAAEPELEHRRFAELPDVLRPGDVLVVETVNVHPVQGRFGPIFLSEQGRVV